MPHSPTQNCGTCAHSLAPSWCHPALQTFSFRPRPMAWEILVPWPTEVPPDILYATIFIKYLPTCSKRDTGLDREDT